MMINKASELDLSKCHSSNVRQITAPAVYARLLIGFPKSCDAARFEACYCKRLLRCASPVGMRGVYRLSYAYYYSNMVKATLLSVLHGSAICKSIEKHFTIRYEPCCSRHSQRHHSLYSHGLREIIANSKSVSPFPMSS